VNANPASYGNWVALGSLYSTLVAKPLAVEGAYENAQFAFNEAYKRNPANPGLPLLLAQLEINKENLDNARSYIRNSIALKDDYADAYLLLARLEAGAKNIPAAIASTEKLSALSPDNAGIYFELGVLKYSNSDFTGALAALEKALTLSPDYANAQYYRALTLAQVGRVDEAKAALEALLATNPDSAELKAALEALSNPKKK
jgi:tetratricopeptide (TPR) repeat protein